MSVSFSAPIYSREALEETPQIPIIKPAVPQSLGLHVKSTDDIFGKIPRNCYQVYFWKEGWGMRAGHWKEAFQYTNTFFFFCLLSVECTACNYSKIIKITHI